MNTERTFITNYLRMKDYKEELIWLKNRGITTVSSRLLSKLTGWNNKQVNKDLFKSEEDKLISVYTTLHRLNTIK